MNEEDALDAFAALSHAARLQVLKLLVKAGPDGMVAGELAAAIGATPSRASFHLSVLAEAGLVMSERAAKKIRYFVNFGQMGALAAYLLQECCGGQITVPSCESRKKGL